MKNAFIAVAALAVAVTAGVVAYRLSADALAMIVGVVLGFAALIPTVILAVVFLRRQSNQATDTRPAAPQAPVVVIAGGFPAQMLPQQPAPYTAQQQFLPPPTVQQPRQFRMVGYEATDAIEVSDAEWSVRG